MNTKRYVLGSIAVFVFMFFFEFLYHGMALESLYAQVPEMLRPEEEFKGLFHWLVLIV